MARRPQRLPPGDVKPPTQRERAEQKAAEWAETLESEGYSRETARLRARRAYGLCSQGPSASPDAEGPDLPREWQRAAREEYAQSSDGDAVDAVNVHSSVRS